MLYEVLYFPELAREEKKLLSEQPTIHPSCKIYNSRIGSWTELMENCTLIETTFDDYSYAAGDVSIIYSEIGKFCSIASHVRINPSNHPMERVTQHHSTYRRVQYGFDTSDDEGIFNWRRAHPCVIGHDVWIGHSAVIMPGVKVGTGAVIGSGAVVTKDAEPYQIVAGVPAKPIRKRFSEEVIEKLMKSEWWNWDRKTLKERFHDLLDLKQFIEKYE
ncbi:MAG: acetyltransferase [Clostridia bacterium]|nr:acetyltransferase [Clostridia bacterium]